MGRKKKKFYVVWAGHQPGIYLTWIECKAQTDNFPGAEFLAIVHALALFEKQGIQQPIYSDSAVAIGWINKKYCKTTIAHDESNQKLFELMTRAEYWLNTNIYANKILKWHTHLWGEISADFGRK